MGRSQAYQPAPVGGTSAARLPGASAIKVFCLTLFLVAGRFKADPRLAWIPVDLTLLAAGATSFWCVLEFLKHGMRMPRRVFAVLSFFALFLPALALNLPEGYGLEKTLRFYTLTMLAAVAPMLLIRDGRDLRRFLNLLALFGGLMAFAALATIFANGGSLRRVTSFGSNTISLGRLTGLSLVWVVTLVLRKDLTPWLGAPIAGAFAMVLLASGSRGPILAAILGVGAILLLGVRQRSHRRSMTIVVLALVIVFALLLGLRYMPSLAVERVGNFFAGNFGVSEMTRMKAIGLSLETIAAQPWGIGLGGFAERINLWQGHYRQYPHNILVEVFLEGGWMPFLWLVGLLWMALLEVHRASRRYAQPAELMVFPGVLLFVVFNAMVSGDLNDNKLVFTFLGLALGLSRIAERGMNTKAGESR